MKKTLLVLALLCCTVTLFAKPPKGWTTDYEAALETAKRENKYVYVLFTGSDWCGWCVKLRKDVLTQKKFENFARTHLVLVYCDFPKRNKLSAEQLRKQREWSRKLGAGGGVPSAVIVDSNGKVVGKIGGYRKLKDYMKELNKIVK